MLLAISVFLFTALASDLQVLARLLREVREQEEQEFLRMARTPKDGGSAVAELNFVDTTGKKFQMIHWDEDQCVVSSFVGEVKELKSNELSKCANAHGKTMVLSAKRADAEGKIVWTSDLKKGDQDFSAVADKFNEKTLVSLPSATGQGKPMPSSPTDRAKEMNAFFEGQLYIQRGNKQIEIENLVIGQASFKNTWDIFRTRHQYWWIGAEEGCKIITNYNGASHALKCTVKNPETDPEATEHFNYQPIYIYAGVQGQDSKVSKQEFIIDIPETTWAKALTIPDGEHVPLYDW